ncbi:hypothetical protein HD806DRAFT_193773 [Xylariaceae sp. AK1471]|nr:hypothetical protein HD806DRAFT_193773 [Xylariaceae sp. AK1471]
MAELGRVAQAAIRSTSLLRTTPIRSQPCHNLALACSISGRNHISTTRSLCSSNEPVKPTSTFPTSPVSRTQQQSYSSSSWTNPSRGVTRGSAGNIADINIRKPNSSSYDLAFGGQKDKKDKDQVEFASDFDLDLDITDIKPKKSSGINAQLPPRVHLRMVPRTGRTVHVKNNVDVARSFKLLAVQIAQNRLRQDFQSQRFHERPGKKRKRLRSERWQKRFKKGFKATVSRVRELTAQGW